MQPGLPRYLPFPQQLASERCICKFNRAQAPSPCSSDTLISQEFPRAGSVLRARRHKQHRPSAPSSRDGSGGAGRSPKAAANSARGTARGGGHRGAFGHLCLSQSSCSCANARAPSVTETRPGADWPHCSFGSSLFRGFAPSISAQGIQRTADCSCCKYRPRFAEADKAQASYGTSWEKPAKKHLHYTPRYKHIMQKNTCKYLI